MTAVGVTHNVVVRVRKFGDRDCALACAALVTGLSSSLTALRVETVESAAAGQVMVYSVSLRCVASRVELERFINANFDPLAGYYVGDDGKLTDGGRGPNVFGGGCGGGVMSSVIGGESSGLGCESSGDNGTVSWSCQPVADGYVTVIEALHELGYCDDPMEFELAVGGDDGIIGYVKRRVGLGDDVESRLIGGRFCVDSSVESRLIGGGKGGIAAPRGYVVELPLLLKRMIGVV